MEEGSPEYQAVAAVAVEAARAAGRLLREEWLRPRTVSRKGFRDLVTDVDLEAQQLIRRIVRDRFPAHRFLGEEETPDHFEPAPAETDTVWIVDPVDGTSNYSRQVPVFSISIGVASPTGMQIGVVFDPLRDELFYAGAGQGAFLDDRPLAVSQIADPAHALLAIDWGHSHQLRERTLVLLNRFAHRVQTIRAIGSAALALAWLAAGRVDIYYNVNLKPWDVAAGGLIVQEAGGTLSRFDGTPWTWEEPVTACLAANASLHTEMLLLVSP